MNTQKHRIQILKSLFKLASIYLDHYKMVKNDKTNNWIDKKSDLIIQELRAIKTKIKNDLHPTKVETYCSPMPKLEGISLSELLSGNKKDGGKIFNAYISRQLEQTNANLTLFSIARLAPEQNIIHDISWLTDGNISDRIDISLGIKPITYFEKYLNLKIKNTENTLIPYFENQPQFYEIIEIIKQAIRHSDKKHYLISNILLITATESIVRKLCQYIYQKQNPDFTTEQVQEFVYSQFTSLDSLISKGEWKNDFPISLNEATIIYNDVNEETINYWREKINKHAKAIGKLKELTTNLPENFESLSPENKTSFEKKLRENLKALENALPDLLSEDEHQIKINLSIMLHFLIRKYKDDRNLIIHGNFESFNHKWKNYINYSALLKVFDTYNKYTEYYDPY